MSVAGGAGTPSSSIDVAEPDSLPIDARVIETELARLWQQAAEGAPGGMVRASSLTVLVLLLEPGLAPRVEDVLAEVPIAHPCRAIVIALDELEPRAQLGGHCRPPRAGQPPVCWEEIRLEGPRAALNRIMSAAESLVLPNLSVQAWWPGDVEVGSPLFRRVVEIGDRIVIDSGQFGDPLASLARYADQAQGEHGTVGFVDLAWQRLEPWRLLVAQFFDHPPDRDFLSELESVAIGYRQPGNGSAGGSAEALLLVGWLASRLGWTLAAARSTRAQGSDALAFDDGNRLVRVDIRRLSGQTGPGGLASVELRASDEGKAAVYSVERVEENARTVADVGGTRREAQVRLPTSDEAELLKRELGAFGRDRIYEDALQVVRLIAQRVEVGGSTT